MTASDVASTQVAVLGGGLAGLSAALRLSEMGVSCQVIETRKRLGGRAGSFRDPQTGNWLDNCQHVLMGCCTYLLDFYRRSGVDHLITWHDRIFFCDEQGMLDCLEADSLPAPLHLAASGAGLRFLSPSDKWHIARAAGAMLRLTDRQRADLHAVDFRTWLLRQGQPRRLIDRFWGVVIISALNEPPERAAADYAIQVFRDGFFAHPSAYEVGLAQGSLQELYEPAGRSIEQAGNAVRTGVSIEGIERSAEGEWVIHTSKGTLRAQQVISALPFERLSRLFANDATAQAVCPWLTAKPREDGKGSDPSPGQTRKLEHSPIVGIHLWFSRPFLPAPLVALIGSPLHWVFNKGNGHLHGVISAAREQASWSSDQITGQAVSELQQRFPGCRSARLIRSIVVKEKLATFSASPGINPLRPTPQTKAEGFFLAGDWCRTGWPATMEGAVRSGYAAARAWAATHRPDLIEQIPAIGDLPPGRLVRWFGGR